ncbi:hypothetical protein KCU71_g2983, partial [Aureobasidium melanogenum]
MISVPPLFSTLTVLASYCLQLVSNASILYSRSAASASSSLSISQLSTHRLKRITAMDLQLKNSSLDSARTNDPDLQHSDSSTETTSTSTPAAHNQDSPFLRLPLELRYMIYNYSFDYRHRDWAWYKPCERFDPLLSLFHVSRQTRVEIKALVAESRMCLRAFISFSGMAILTYSVYHISPKIERCGEKIVVPWAWLHFDEKAPHDFRFWKIMLSFTSAQKSVIPVTADIDLKRKAVHLLGTGTLEAGNDGRRRTFDTFKDASGLAVQALEKPLFAAIQAIGRSADSDGFTFQQIRRLVEQAVLPGRKHFESLEKVLGVSLLPGLYGT